MACRPVHRIGPQHTHRRQGMVLILRTAHECVGEFRPVRHEPQHSADGLLLGPGKVGEEP